MKRRSPFADKLHAFADFAFGDEHTTRHRGKWRAFFAERERDLITYDDAATDLSVVKTDNDRRRLILEIGCFTAEFLTRIARSHPAAGFIGLDWKAKAMFQAAQHVESQAVRNVALLRAHAQDLSAIFEDGELDEIWLFHPDPFDDPRDAVMRLMSAAFLSNAHRLLRTGGRLILKTDHAEYFETSRALLEESRDAFEIDTESTDFWRDEAALRSADARAFAGESTLFESRFVRRNQPIYYLDAKRR